VPFLTDGIENEKQFSILQRHLFQEEFLVLNVRRPPLDDLRVRRAMRLAIDRTRMRMVIVGAAGLRRGAIYRLSDSAYPPGHPMYDPSTPLVQHDVAAANRMLEAAGWLRGPDGIRVKAGRRLEISFAGPSQAPLVHQAEELTRANLLAVGAVLETRNYTNAFLNDPKGPIRQGNYDMAVSDYFLDGFGDLSAFYGCNYFVPNGINLSKFCDPALEPLLGAFKQTYDESARRPIAARIQREIFDAAPYINLASIDAFWVANNDLHGFQPNRSGFYDNFMNVDI
jgi:ABC-type transport system substrate-binding protein